LLTIADAINCGFASGFNPNLEHLLRSVLKVHQNFDDGGRVDMICKEMINSELKTDE